MDIVTLKKVLPVLMKRKVVPFLWGNQGVGKTQTVKQVAQSLGGGFVHLNLANQEVGDLVGLLVHGPNGTVHHARPAWFPTEGHGVIFLDELNRMHPDVMQAIFSFITDGTIHNHQLPAGWSIVAAGNYQNNDFQVTDTSDAAWMSRFCHIDFRPTAAEFVNFAETKGAASVAAFIRDQPMNLEKELKKGFDFSSVTPDRRAWLDRISALELEESIEEERFELYQGLVGAAAAAAFLTHKKKAEKSLTIHQILSNYGNVRLRVVEASNAGDTRFDFINQPVAELLALLGQSPNTLENEQTVTNLKHFLLDIPLELSQRAFKDLRKLTFKNKMSILNDSTFCEQLMSK